MKEEQVEIRFDDRGLVPAVVQDVTTGQVLMVAWMNEEALQRTRETGQVHFCWTPVRTKSSKRSARRRWR